jgi:hypothetical protein
MSRKAKRLFIAVFLVITPPALLLLSAAMSVERERHVREGRLDPAPYWETLFPIALVACFIGIPLGAYLAYRALCAGPEEM